MSVNDYRRRVDPPTRKRNMKTLTAFLYECPDCHRRFAEICAVGYAGNDTVNCQGVVGCRGVAKRVGTASKARGFRDWNRFKAEYEAFMEEGRVKRLTATDV